MLGKYLIPEIYCTPKEAPAQLAHRQVPGHPWLVATVPPPRLRWHSCSSRRSSWPHGSTSGYKRGIWKRSNWSIMVWTLFTVQVLQRLADMPEVFVSVITGRCLPDIKAKVSTGCLDLCEGMWTSSQFDALQLSRWTSRTSPMLGTMGWTSSTLTAQSSSHPCLKRWTHCPIPKTSLAEVEKENDPPRYKMEFPCQGGVESKLVASEAASRMLPGATDDELRIMWFAGKNP